jgi:hypothetical protein
MESSVLLELDDQELNDQELGILVQVRVKCKIK